MTKIEDMLKELCPNGVEWKELGEVVDVLDSLRKPITKSKRINGHFPYYGANGIQDFVADYIFDGTYILMGEDGSVIKNDNTPILHWVTGKIWVNNHAHILSEKKELASLRYLYHILSKTDISDIVRGRPLKLNQKNLKAIKVPIPPLEIQQEIVQILDKFTDYVTELTAELTAELTLRQKQYTYFRDYLLNFDQEGSGGANDKVYQVEWKTLGEIVGFRRGSFPQPYGKKEWYGGENSQPFVQVADVSENGYCLNVNTQKRISQKAIPRSVFVPKGTVLVTLQGTIGRVAITQYDAYVDRTIAIFDDYKCDINIKYFAYQLKRKFDIEKEFARGSTLKTITKQEFSQFQLPIPSLEIQSRIVQVLDNFDTVCNDLNIGLPKEIELRQKQYEYFRDKLLTFTAEGVYTDSTVQYSTDKT